MMILREITYRAKLDDVLLLYIYLIMLEHFSTRVVYSSHHSNSILAPTHGARVVGDSTTRRARVARRRRKGRVTSSQTRRLVELELRD